MNISIKKKWSKKYKAKINCKNPKGFSQKQYCKYGRKKMKGGGGSMSLLSTPTNAYDPYIEVPDSDGHPIICPICMRGFEYGKPNVLVCGGVYGKETGEGCQSAFHWDCWEEMKKTTRKRTCPVCRRNPTTLYLKELIDNITPERILIDQAKPKWDWPHSRKWFDGDLRSIDVNTGFSKRGGGKRKTKRKKSKRINTRRKMKGGGGMFSRPRVQPEGNYGYEIYNNSTTVVPVDFVTAHNHTKIRIIWKRGIPTHENLKDDYHGNYVDHWISVIVDPIGENDNDWLFYSISDEGLDGEIKNYIEDYRSRLRKSLARGRDTYDIRLKIYELLAIKYHLAYNPIQEARAEIVRPAEPASASINGGKRKKMKGVKNKRRTRRKRIK